MHTNLSMTSLVFAEIRSHGVGFYQFAKDEDTRVDQMDALHKIRDQVRLIHPNKMRLVVFMLSLQFTQVHIISDWFGDLCRHSYKYSM